MKLTSKEKGRIRKKIEKLNKKKSKRRNSNNSGSGTKIIFTASLVFLLYTVLGVIVNLINGYPLTDMIITTGIRAGLAAWVTIIAMAIVDYLSQ